MVCGRVAFHGKRRKSRKGRKRQRQLIRADFREGDEHSNFSVFRIRRFIEWPGPLHWIAFPVEILTKLLIHWIASLLFTEKKRQFFHWKVLRRIPFPKIGSDFNQISTRFRLKSSQSPVQVWSGWHPLKSGGLKGGHLKGGQLKMGFRSEPRTWKWDFALKFALDTSTLTALSKGIPQGKHRLDRKSTV